MSKIVNLGSRAALVRSTLGAGTLALAMSSMGCQSGRAQADAKVSSGLVSQYAGFAQLSSRFLELDPPSERPENFAHGGVQAALSMGSVGVNAMGILSLPKDEATSVTLDLHRQGPLPRSSSSEDGCVCDDHGCKFVDCKAPGGGTLNGSFSWTKDSMTCDYEFIISGSKGSDAFHYHRVECDLRYGESSIEGELSSKGAYKGEYKDKQYHSDWDLHIEFQAVELDDYGRPNKGKAQVDATVTSHTYDETLNGAELVDFGDEE